MPDRLSAVTDPLFSEERSHLLERIGKQRFFHDMDLGPVKTGSWVYDATVPPNYHLLPVFRYLTELNLSALTCIDVGTYDGMTAFVLAELGASSVHATCLSDLERFRLVRALKNYRSVAYYPQSGLDDFEELFAPGSTDVVVMSAMLHHLTAPLDGLLAARRVLRRGGYLVLEAIVARDESGSALHLNSRLDDPVYGVPTIWVPTEGALMGMLQTALFEIVSTTRLLGGRIAREPNYDRITFLARAVLPGDLSGTTAKMKELHQGVKQLGPLSFEHLDQSQRSSATYSGAAGVRGFNIWLDSADVPLQPRWSDPSRTRGTLFRLGTETDLQVLAASIPDGAFREADIFGLAARYPGEAMPEGMRWGLKQLGNLHILERIATLGAERVLEVGAGFNLYFPNHLPSWCSYTGLDKAGFYDTGLMAMRGAHTKAPLLEGLMGEFSPALAPDSFDACFSVSVLEHVLEADIARVCEDMFRVTRPGGWTLHSIDLPRDQLSTTGTKWYDALLAAGFAIDEGERSIDPAAEKYSRNTVLTEPLSIVAKFYGRYRGDIWGRKGFPVRQAPMHTILVSARKPA